MMQQQSDGRMQPGTDDHKTAFPQPPLTVHSLTSNTEPCLPKIPTSISVLNASFATAPSSGDEEDDMPMPWEEDDFVPRTASGKQKSPNMIRSELQRYIDASSETKTAIAERMGVSYNSFSKFMNPKAYKDQWSAVQNGTYWAAARLLEQAKQEAKTTKQASKKRKTLRPRSSLTW